MRNSLNLLFWSLKPVRIAVVFDLSNNISSPITKTAFDEEIVIVVNFVHEINGLMPTVANPEPIETVVSDADESNTLSPNVVIESGIVIDVNSLFP